MLIICSIFLLHKILPPKIKVAEQKEYPACFSGFKKIFYGKKWKGVIYMAHYVSSIKWRQEGGWVEQKLRRWWDDEMLVCSHLFSIFSPLVCIKASLINENCMCGKMEACFTWPSSFFYWCGRELWKMEKIRETLINVTFSPWKLYMPVEFETMRENFHMTAFLHKMEHR